MGNCCKGVPQNTGYPNFKIAFKDIVRFHIFFAKADDQTENFIDPAQVGNEDYLNGLTQEPDTTKRLRPISKPNSVKEVTPTRSETSFQTFKDQSTKPLQQGVHTFSAMLIDTLPAYIEKLNSFGCRDTTIILEDSCGNLIGRVKKGQNDKLFGMPLNYVDNYYMFADAGATVDGVSFNFQISNSMPDEEIGFIAADSIADKELEGLVDVTLADAVSNSTTEVTVKAYTCFGEMNQGKAVGLDVDSFTVLDSTGAPLAVSAVDNSNLDENYIITHADATTNIPVSVTGAPGMYDLDFEIGNTVTAP